MTRAAQWQPINAYPTNMPSGETGGERPGKVLLYSAQLGIVIGEVFMWPDRCEPRANVPNFSGNAIDDWGVTYWMPLPEVPA